MPKSKKLMVVNQRLLIKLLDAVESSQGVKVATFYQWKYSHYFKVMDESEKNMRARYSLCSPSSKPLSCARNTTSNFKKYLDTAHKM